MQLEQDDFSFTLTNIYVPNSDSPNFFVEMAEHLNSFNEHRIIVGDFNLVLDPDLDSKNVTNNNKKSLAILSSYIEEALLCDIWRIRNPQKRIYSYMRRKPHFKARRLDYSLVSNGLQGHIEDTFYLPGLLSDHSAFCMIIEFVKKDRGKSYWKLNTLHLRDAEYLDLINKTIACQKQDVDQKMGVYHVEMCRCI